MIKSPYKINKNFSKLNPFSKKNLLNIYHKLYFSRFVEEVIQNEYPNQQMKTPTHLGIGQEAISVGVFGLNNGRRWRWCVCVFEILEL